MWSVKPDNRVGRHDGEFYFSRGAFLSNCNHSGNRACSSPEITGGSGQHDPTAGCCRPTAGPLTDRMRLGSRQIGAALMVAVWGGAIDRKPGRDYVPAARPRKRGTHPRESPG